MNTKPFDRKLPCDLTEGELATKRDEIARKIHEYRLVEDEKKEETSKYAKRLKDLRADMEKLGLEITDRTEERLVRCYEHSVWSASRVDVIREDTGEVISSRPMTQEERQQDIFPRESN